MQKILEFKLFIFGIIFLNTILAESNGKMGTSSTRNNPETTTTTATLSIADNNFSATPTTHDSNDNFETKNRIVCYARNWARYTLARFDASFILPDLCTHLIYAFAIVINNTVVPSDYYVDIDQMGYVNFNKIKFKNPKIKTLISVNQNRKSNDSSYSAIVNNPERRQEFIKNVLNFLKMHNFDGVDIHWQYPGEISTDKENFAQFLKEINAKFLEDAIVSKTPKLLLTITIPSEKSYLDRGYDIPKINDFVDWFNLFSFNYHKPTELNVNHLAPLYSLEGIDESENNVNASAFNCIESGIDKSKLVVGIPTYGISYKLANKSLTDINSPAAGPGIKGEFNLIMGYLAFYEICQQIFYSDPEFGWNVVKVEPQVMGPYAFRGNDWIAYDDEEMVRTKAEYVADNGLGGLMFWSIDQDDFRSLCDDEKPFPVIQAGKRALLEKSKFLSSNVVSLPSPRPPAPPPTKSPFPPPGTRPATYLPPTAPSRPSSTTTKPDQNTTTTVADNFMCSEAGLFPNPRDCRTYFACIDVYGYKEGYKIGIRLISLRCAEGAYFNRKRRDCRFIDTTSYFLYCIEENKNDNELNVLPSRNNTPITETAFNSQVPMAVETSSLSKPIVPPSESETSTLPNFEVPTAVGSFKPSKQDNNNINRFLQVIENSGGFGKFEQFLKLFLSNQRNFDARTPVASLPSSTTEASLSVSKFPTNTENIKLTLKTQIKVNENINKNIQSQLEIPKPDSSNANKLIPLNNHINELHIHNVNIYL